MRDGGLFCSDTVIGLEPAVLFRWTMRRDQLDLYAESEAGKETIFHIVLHESQNSFRQVIRDGASFGISLRLGTD
jgi:hypothetical protein